LREPLDYSPPCATVSSSRWMKLQQRIAVLLERLNQRPFRKTAGLGNRPSTAWITGAAAAPSNPMVYAEW